MFQTIIFWIIFILFLVNLFKRWGLFRLFYRIEPRLLNPHSVQIILMILGLSLAFYFDKSILVLFVLGVVSILHNRMVKAFERVNERNNFQ